MINKLGLLEDSDGRIGVAVKKGSAPGELVAVAPQGWRWVGMANAVEAVLERVTHQGKADEGKRVQQ